MAQGARRRLGAEDWADAALRAVGDAGLAGIAVEPLAARLGTTKGSFYWHFANRDALVEATLARWEDAHTESVIALMDTEPDPAVRLRLLFATVVEQAIGARVELTLLASADDARVGPVLRRVTARRIGYLADLFVALGFEAAEARRRGLLAYTLYLGHVQLAHSGAAELPADGAARRAHFDTAIALLTSGP